MRTQYIPSSIEGVCLHNTAHWQVTELMGGLACELLHKSRVVSPVEQRERKLSTHDCYEALFMQGDEASEFLAELANAQAKLTPKDVDSLMLSAYSDVLQ